jgi:hypothetical protein
VSAVAPSFPMQHPCCNFQESSVTILFSGKTPASCVFVIGSERKTGEKGSENTYVVPHCLRFEEASVFAGIGMAEERDGLLRK